MEMIKRILGALLIVGAGIAGVALALLFFLREAENSEQPNPYEYRIDAFLSVPAELIRYSETGRIKPDMKGIAGIAVDRSNRVYVAGATGVAIFDGTGASAGGFPIAEPGLCLAVDGQGLIYVGMRDHVEVYDSTGAREAAWESMGEEARITSIAVSSAQVFVADYGSRSVWRFANSGALIHCLGGTASPKGDGESGFIIPSPYFDVAADPDGTVWIANPGRQRVEHYTAEGRWLSLWGKSGMGIGEFCGCCNPSHLALMPDGKFVTSEKGLPRVKVCNRAGELESVVAAPNQFKKDAVGLDVAVDSAGRVWVLDASAGAVRVFQRQE